MKKVQISGVGCTNSPGSNHIEKSFKQLIVEASYDAIKDANLSPKMIDGASFSYAGEGEIGHGGVVPTLVDALGLSPLSAFINVGNCASAHMAFIQGCEMIESGNYKHVLVAGFDKMTDVLPFENYMLLSTDSMYDYSLGFSHIDSFLFQNEYVRKYHINPNNMKKALLKFGKLMRKNAFNNTIATNYRKPVPDDSLLEKMPLCGNALNAGEGASAVILSSVDTNNNSNRNIVTVAGKSLLNTSHYIPHRYDYRLINHNNDKKDIGMHNGEALELCVNNAYKQASINSNALNVLELYDQGYNTFVSIEASHICPKGKAVDYINSGGGDFNTSSLKINTDGGNIGRGHAGGGASLYQIIEIVKQLQGRSTGKQISDKNYGMSTVIGGSYATASAVILKNEGRI